MYVSEVFTPLLNICLHQPIRYKTQFGNELMWKLDVVESSSSTYIVFIDMHFSPTSLINIRTVLASRTFTIQHFTNHLIIYAGIIYVF